MRLANTFGIGVLILDMDGVLWKDEEPIGDLPAIFSTINSSGFEYILASNNSTKTINQYLDKLSRFGVSLEESHILSSSYVTVNYLVNKYPNGGPVFIIGESGLFDLLSAAGFYYQENDVLAVVVGMDRKFSYQKLGIATTLIRSGVEFIGTNSDRTFPTPSGLAPGAGSILAAITAATDIHPLVLGKPSPAIYHEALLRMDTIPEQTLVVGDRLETDIAGGQFVGCKTALVLSGVTGKLEGLKWKPVPEFIVADLSELIRVLVKND